MIILWDLDGTLSNCDEFKHFIKQEPKNWNGWNENIINHKVYHDIAKLYTFCDRIGCRNFIVTTRKENVRADTEQWLINNGLHEHYEELLMRGMNDFRPDFEVKLDILNTLRRNNILPDMAFEDKGSVVQMYRENGLRCFQVCDGEY